MSNSKKMITQIGKIVGQSINAYYPNKLKSKVDEVKFKETYQGRIIDCMVGEVDDNYIETPETDAPVVKLEHSKEGVVKIPSIKGKTILVDADGQITDTPGEGCRLVSVGEQEDNKLIILSKNKNLFDNSERVNGYYWSADNTETKHNTSYLSRTYIKVNQETYVTNGNTQVLEYDKDKNFIRRVQVTNHAYTPTENVGYVRLSYYDHGIDFKGQFELGNISTTYVEPKHHKTEILLDEPLRGLSNGVCDEIVGNQLIRRVGTVYTEKIIQKGTVDFHWYREEINQVRICISNVLPLNCTERGSILTNNNYSNWCTYKLGHIYVHLTKEQYGNLPLDSKGATQWVKDNPCEIYYELAEPTIEELPNLITLQGFDDTTMYIENSITPTVTYGYNALIPYKQELSQQKEEVKTNTSDIENNIIPYLMDMEFNIMLMEGDINGTEG